MPTKKKRVGFIPREDVMEIIDNLGKENNLSNSKIISILVEEALSMRGILNKRNYKEKSSNLENEAYTKCLSEDPSDFKDDENFKINTKLGNYNQQGKTNLLKGANQQTFDLQTYKNFLLFLKFQEMMEEYNT